MVSIMRMAVTPCRTVHDEGGDGMAREDDEPATKRRRLEPLLLDSLGIEELRSYITELQAEITRVEADIGRKNSHRSAADAFFRKP
jgi:uncharacterized small protein (DUF1192 family)